MVVHAFYKSVFPWFFMTSSISFSFSPGLGILCLIESFFFCYCFFFSRKTVYSFVYVNSTFSMNCWRSKACLKLEQWTYSKFKLSIWDKDFFSLKKKFTNHLLFNLMIIIFKTVMLDYIFLWKLLSTTIDVLWFAWHTYLMIHQRLLIHLIYLTAKWTNILHYWLYWFHLAFELPYFEENNRLHATSSSFLKRPCNHYAIYWKNHALKMWSGYKIYQWQNIISIISDASILDHSLFWLFKNYFALISCHYFSVIY